MADEIEYGNWRIAKARYIPAAQFSWEYWHKDYDGPEDGRAGIAASPDACRSEIDEGWSE